MPEDGGEPSSDRRRASPSELFGAGFGAGVVTTGVLNPVDRALFLSVAKQRPFLDARNWRRPYQGLAQGLVGRAVSTGLWFPLERIARDATSHSGLGDGMSAAVAGQSAGAVNALLLSPLAMVKYQTWGIPEGKRHVLLTARKMYRTAGAAVFFRGLPATVWRDAAFGAVFGYSRQKLRALATDQTPSSTSAAVRFVADACAAALATAVSAPFNYARNVQFSQPVTEPALGTSAALAALKRETLAHAPPLERVAFLQRRLNVGWGTLRVACGMAIASWSFERLVGAALWARP